MSGVSATSARIGSASASMRSDRLSPPWGLGSTEPVRRHSSYHLIAADAATPKRSAAARRLMPASTAPTTRKRRSRSSGLVMAAGLLPPAATLNQNSTTLGIPLDSVRAEYALAALELQDVEADIAVDQVDQAARIEIDVVALRARLAADRLGDEMADLARRQRI